MPRSGNLWSVRHSDRRECDRRFEPAAAAATPAPFRREDHAAGRNGTEPAVGPQPLPRGCPLVDRVPEAEAAEPRQEGVARGRVAAARSTTNDGRQLPAGRQVERLRAHVENAVDDGGPGRVPPLTDRLPGKRRLPDAAAVAGIPGADGVLTTA